MVDSKKTSTPNNASGQANLANSFSKKIITSVPPAYNGNSKSPIAGNISSRKKSPPRITATIATGSYAKRQQIPSDQLRPKTPSKQTIPISPKFSNNSNSKSNVDEK